MSWEKETEYEARIFSYDDDNKYYNELELRKDYNYYYLSDLLQNYLDLDAGDWKNIIIKVRKGAILIEEMKK